MKAKEYAKLLDYIEENHKVCSKNGRSVKYVSCHFDNRDGEIYTLSIREWFQSKRQEFDINFDTNGIIKLTYDNIVNWLKEDKD